MAQYISDIWSLSVAQYDKQSRASVGEGILNVLWYRYMLHASSDAAFAPFRTMDCNKEQEFLDGVEPVCYSEMSTPYHSPLKIDHPEDESLSRSGL